MTMTRHDTPSHYAGGTIEPIEYIQDHDLDFALGNVVKYVTRAGLKSGESVLSDLRKARAYLDFEIERVGEGGVPPTLAHPRPTCESCEHFCGLSDGNFCFMSGRKVSVTAVACPAYSFDESVCGE